MSRWGRLTMLVGLAISLAAPAYLLFFAGLGATPAQVLTAFLAVAGAFGFLWMIEPVTYFPILGESSIYQAFMTGNIANKLLPAALTAQTAIGARPGTRRGGPAPVSAISGAVMVHLTSLVLVVGFFGTWFIANLPPTILHVMQVYIVPTVFGAVPVQALAHLKQPRTAAIAVLVSVTVVFVISPAVPAFGMYATVAAVASTIILAWDLRKRRTAQ
ncbi:hypothetical protein [Arthrobacter sp. SDTb3-6]|uniref:hypothetical protein n=1 Tax=Arthrobacter sp. SDTb3-6 TaxID=2713571 RepID=UPI0035247216